MKHIGKIMLATGALLFSTSLSAAAGETKNPVQAPVIQQAPVQAPVVQQPPVQAPTQKPVLQKTPVQYTQYTKSCTSVSCGYQADTCRTHYRHHCRSHRIRGRCCN